jgi:hypothetical protein
VEKITPGEVGTGMGLPACRADEDVAGDSAGLVPLGVPLATAAALLTARSVTVSPVSRAAVLNGADPADPAAVMEVLEVITAAMLRALPDGGEDLLQRLGLLAADWQYGGDGG